MISNKVTFLTLAMAILLTGAGCIGVSNTAIDNLEIGDTSKVPAAEAALGFDLPSDAEITVVINNPQAYSVSFLTDLSMRDVQAYFAEELAEEGYSIKRQFGSLPTDSDTQTSVLYSKGSTVVAIGISIKGGRTSVSLQKQ